MKLGIKTLAIVIVISSALACDSNKRGNENASANENTEQVNQDYRKTKSEWETKLNAKIDEVDRRIERAEDDSELERKLEDTKRKLESNLEKIEDSSEDTWDDVKRNVESAFDKISNELEALGDKIENELD